MKKSTCFTLFLVFLSTMCSIVLGCAKPKYAYALGEYSEIVIEQSTGRVLYENAAHKRMPMASTTKIATCITAIENYSGDINGRVRVPDCAVGVEGSSLYLKKGETLLFSDLLYGLMMRSGNDCAVSVAVLTAGSVEKFAALMNKTAEKAGAVSTHFVNPHGLHDKNHYTTAADLASITAYAMKNDLFRKIVSCKRYELSRSDDRCGQIIVNKNKLLFSFDGADGVKTGYTKNAGRCLVSSATRDGMTVIAVTLNCAPMFSECSRLMEYAFDNYEMRNLTPEGTLSYCVDASGTKFYALGVAENFYYPVKKDGSENVGYSICDVKIASCDAKQGDENGKLNIYLDKRLLFSQKLFII